jgi:hypothetical protein
MGVHIHVLPIHMQADLRDIKQYRVPSLAPKPRNITPKRTSQTCLLFCKIGHYREDCPGTSCEPEVHEHSLKSNQCFLDNSEDSMIENCQAYTSSERPSRLQESASIPLMMAVQTLSPGGAQAVTCTVQDGVQKRSRSLPGTSPYK